jgi:hypothetical protein
MKEPANISALESHVKITIGEHKKAKTTIMKDFLELK